MRVWIDLANSPHPLFFAPLARRLEESGHTIAVTARDNAQTVELARERWPDVEVVGGASPRSRVGKARVMAGRVAGLVRWARRHRPELALSHNSYGQLLAASIVRVPRITTMDYEHQPANHLAFRLADLVLLPEALRDSGMDRQGAVPSKTIFYGGLKEELYLADFEPDPAVLTALALEREADRPLVVLRSPPSRAAYHRLGNPLFLEALRMLGHDERVRCVALARHPEQRRAIEALRLPNCVVPERAVDARSLMYEADLVVGAGGTMTREAALLGIPTRSVFAGPRPAVDRWLEGEGRMRRLESADDVRRVDARSRPPRPLGELRERSASVSAPFLDAVERLQAEGVPS
jgi:predicted glycosyltransferase